MVEDARGHFPDWEPPLGVEEWRAISDAPGYEVSDWGRVRSYWARPSTFGGKATRLAEPRMLRPYLLSGYPSVTLRVLSGRRRKIRVHLLVLAEFVGPKPEGMQSLHRDGNRANAAAANLHWGTQAENYADSVRHGTARARSRSLIGPRLGNGRFWGWERNRQPERNRARTTPPA